MPQKIDLPNFADFSQPEWNAPDSVKLAFDNVLNAYDSSSSSAACDQLLYALGNNHAGTYCSIALGVLPAIKQVIIEGSPWSQRAALEALIDLCGSFEPEPGQELYQGKPLAGLIRQSVSDFSSILNPVSKGGGKPAQSAKELIELLSGFK